MSTAVSMPEVLGRARTSVTPALRAALAVLTDEIRPVAEYHHGFSDAHGRPTGSDGGKGFRPALAVLSAEAVGGTAVHGIPGAVAIELVHNFSLIHDDVIDGDTERRHRPTVWAVFGIGRAVIVGDALLALAQQVVLDPHGTIGSALEETALTGALDGERAARRVADATAAMIAGQALDMAFEEKAHVSLAACLEMEAGKTGALLGCAASIGAAHVGADDQIIEALDSFGIELGLAFQAVDDLLGIWGDPETTGKPTFSDLRQHKKSLPISAALDSRAHGVEELAELLTRADLDGDALARAAALVESCGGRDIATDIASSRLAGALGALDRIDLVEGPAAELIELANFVVERQF
jgi:geranylgeranyl diphosphate synthase type I